jgi:hypothetical protein
MERWLSAMRDLVFHPDSGLLLDFADEEFGGSAQTAIIEDWQDWHHRRHARQGEFICHRHRNHERPWLYLQQRGSLLVACHWQGTELAGSHEIAHGVSDEHRRQVEYVQRAGEAAGFAVRTEVRLPTKVRPDAVVYGSLVSMGVEVQRSDLSVSVAKARTTKIRRAGILPVWFSDRRTNPPWLWTVPGVRMSQDVSWDALPPHRTVMVWSGIRAIVGRRCRNIRNSRCPDRGWCNAWHADHEPRPTLVDDLAEGFPAGELVPIQYRAPSGREVVLIVSRNDKARYEALTGLSGDLPLKDRKVKPQHTERILCGTDAGAEMPLVTSEGWVFPPYIPAPRCEVHGTFMIELVPGKHYCRFCFQANR